MNQLFLNETFKQLWQGKDIFQEAFSIKGESIRKVKSRHTFYWTLQGKGYFIKLHVGCGWREIFKNLFQLKYPVLGAAQEYKAIRHLERIKVNTMTICAFASKGITPANITSFLITEELTNTISLEDFCHNWNTNPPSYELKYKIIKALGTMIGEMHRSGLNHRDCYLCHFLLDKNTLENPKLYVIDLHRAQIRKKVPKRYIMKDLAGIFFSAMDANLSKRDIFHFIQAYTQQPISITLKENASYYKKIYNIARKLYKKIHKKDWNNTIFSE